MTFQFKPAVERSGTLYELPRPVSVLKLQESWDGERFKTLLVDGDTVVGSTRNGVEITLSGEIASQGDALTLTEADMFAAIEELRSQVHVGADDQKYRFYLYHDSGTSTYRFFESCTTVRLETDLSDLAAFRYQLTIHAEDPVIYDSIS